jgi:Fungal specific transcription factor domain
VSVWRSCVYPFHRICLDHQDYTSLRLQQASANSHTRNESHREFANVTMADRVRRIKCDETKPCCLRCTRTGRSCDGYERKLTQNSRRASHKSLLQRYNLQPIPLEPEPCPTSLPVSINFQDQEEARYFRFFYHETADALAGGFDSPLWKRIVFQACHEDPSILNCTVAIAALDRACRDVSSKSSSRASAAHHRYALYQYSKALKGVREAISLGNNSLRSTLIASLLIFCFENFHGDVRLALINVRIAQELMHHWLESKGGSATPRGFSPAPYDIEDEIVQAFAKLDVHMLSWIDIPTSTRNPSNRVPDVQSLPANFCSLIESKYYFDIIANRIFYHLSIVEESRKDPQQSLPTPPNDEDQTLPENLNNVEEELFRWGSAFEPVLKRSRSLEGDKDFVGASILRIHALTLELSIQATKLEISGPQLYDVLLPEYCEVLGLCQAVADHPRFVRSYVFDVGIVPILFLVVVKCRDKMVRLKAIEVLKASSPRREGLWDSMVMARIGEALMKAEGENCKLSPNQWNDIHLRCLNIHCRLPSTYSSAKSKPKYNGARMCLLDWVESRMKVDSVSVRDGL